MYERVSISFPTDRQVHFATVGAEETSETVRSDEEAKAICGFAAVASCEDSQDVRFQVIQAARQTEEGGFQSRESPSLLRPSPAPARGRFSSSPQSQESEDAAPFIAPVDPVAQDIPDYFSIIKHPMDLGTIRAKLESNSIPSLESFVQLVRLVFHNAVLYNKPADPM